MPTDSKKDLAAVLLGAVGGGEPTPEPEISEYGQRLGAATRDAVLHLRALELVEIEDASLDALVAECVEAGLEARSPKQIPRRVIRALIASDHAEEVYGTDDQLSDELRRFFGA
jgi:hypothetical protein